MGEQFEDLGDFICGAVVNVRQKGDKVRTRFISSSSAFMFNHLEFLSGDFCPLNFEVILMQPNNFINE